MTKMGTVATSFTNYASNLTYIKLISQKTLIPNKDNKTDKKMRIGKLNAAPLSSTFNLDQLI